MFTPYVYRVFLSFVVIFCPLTVENKVLLPLSAVVACGPPDQSGGAVSLGTRVDVSTRHSDVYPLYLTSLVDPLADWWIVAGSRPAPRSLRREGRALRYYPPLYACNHAAV